MSAHGRKGSASLLPSEVRAVELTPPHPRSDRTSTMTGEISHVSHVGASRTLPFTSQKPEVSGCRCSLQEQLRALEGLRCLAPPQVSAHSMAVTSLSVPLLPFALSLC